MRKALTIVFALMIAGSSAQAQRAAAVRGVGTQTCKTLVASYQADKTFAKQADQWVLGTITGFFRQAQDDPSRTLPDEIVTRTVFDICKNNPEKTIDEATTIAVGSFPVTEIKQPAK